MEDNDESNSQGKNPVAGIPAVVTPLLMNTEVTRLYRFNILFYFPCETSAFEFLVLKI